MSHELSRRALIKGGAAAGLLATAGALVGCGNRPNKAPATVAESKHAWEVIPDSITDIASVEDFDIVLALASLALLPPSPPPKLAQRSSWLKRPTPFPHAATTSAP